MSFEWACGAVRHGFPSRQPFVLFANALGVDDALQALLGQRLLHEAGTNELVAMSRRERS